MKRWWQWFLAWFRIDLDAVCDASLRLGHVDYHDYPDSFDGEPWHFTELTCKRCGKRFTI